MPAKVGQTRPSGGKEGRLAPAIGAEWLETEHETDHARYRDCIEAVQRLLPTAILDAIRTSFEKFNFCSNTDYRLQIGLHAQARVHSATEMDCRTCREWTTDYGVEETDCRAADYEMMSGHGTHHHGASRWQLRQRVYQHYDPIARVQRPNSQV